jgi:hypothetical protein
MDLRQRAALDLLRSAIVVLDARALATGSLEPYTESADFAVANTLELVSGVLNELIYADEPIEEIGDEPMSRKEAVRLVRQFIERSCEILSGPPPYPFTGIATRAQTFYSLLRSSEDEFSSK